MAPTARLRRGSTPRTMSMIQSYCPCLQRRRSGRRSVRTRRRRNVGRSCGGSSLHRHAPSGDPCSGGASTSAVMLARKGPSASSSSSPPAHTNLPSGNRAAEKHTRSCRRGGFGVHAPVARSTLTTIEASSNRSSSSPNPPSRSTCPSALSLSSMGSAMESERGPHDSGGRAVKESSSASESLDLKTSTVARAPSSLSTPPSTTTPPLTAQHACSARAPPRSDIRSHRSSPGSSLHTSLVYPSSPVTHPPHTTSHRRVRSQSFAPTREALHTPVSRHAPTSPLCSETRAQNSGSAVARETAHFAEARVMGAIGRRVGVCVALPKRKSPVVSRCFWFFQLFC
jgi:hypothetical protein